ncbi:phospholipase D-like domain-containing protein [Nitrosophilus labii]|uniref:phospholipase D-like domain-containing protein n=1 Tax=Nitrosophilus labii TaxID=2706014 RepID=UPI0018D791FA|nr:phospholipase D-like domain-containing protein [Nitrosophilus labii]
MKKFFLFLFFSLFLWADEIYILPYEAKPALDTLLKSIDLSKNQIDIAIYSFTNRKIAKHLKKAAKRGVKIRIIFDKESNLYNKRSQLRYLAKYKNIKTYIISGKPFKKNDSYGKMHMKLMIIDNKRVILGSANYSYSAFGKNYEILYIKDDYKIAKKCEKYFERIKSKAQEY